MSENYWYMIFIWRNVNVVLQDLGYFTVTSCSTHNMIYIVQLSQQTHNTTFIKHERSSKNAILCTACDESINLLYTARYVWILLVHCLDGQLLHQSDL